MFENTAIGQSPHFTDGERNDQRSKELDESHTH